MDKQDIKQAVREALAEQFDSYVAAGDGAASVRCRHRVWYAWGQMWEEHAGAVEGSIVRPFNGDDSPPSSVRAVFSADEMKRILGVGQ